VTALLNKYSTPAERLRGCVWADLFQSATEIERNGGTITGSPGYATKRGIALDGTNDYVTYSIDPVTLAGSTVSFVVEFSSSIASNADAVVCLFDTGAGGYSVTKQNNASSNTLDLELGGTSIATIAHATWSAAYVQGARNVLVVAGTSGATSAWLNGTKILDADATAWSATKETSLVIGAAVGGGNKFTGTVHSLKIFNSALTELEAVDYYDGTTLDYRYRSICHLPMLDATHDATGKRTLDVSGNGNHFTFGDGVTTDRFPVKLPTRGYSINMTGGITEYFGRNMFFDPNADFTMCYHIDSRSTSTVYFWCHRDGAGDGVYHIFSGASSRMLYQGVADIENDQQPINKTFGFVADVSGNLGHFVDGVLIGESDISGQTIDVTDPSFFIGRRNGDLANPYEGYIYQFQAWDRVLTPIQIADWHIRAMREINQI